MPQSMRSVPLLGVGRPRALAPLYTSYFNGHEWDEISRESFSQLALGLWAQVSSLKLSSISVKVDLGLLVV